jgi:hypothetical protein
VPTSTAHESVLLWLRDDPSRLGALLSLTGHALLAAQLAVEDSALRVAFPVEVTPDLVLREATSAPARRWVLVEVQRQPDEAKARRWPLAMAAMANRHGPHGELVVITSSAKVARWAHAVAFHRAGETGWGVTPTVLRLGLREAATIIAHGPPEMAVFAAWAAQGRRGGRALAIAEAALARAATIADGALRRAVEEGILAVLHPTIVGKVKRGPMIDINQLPKNPAVEQWKAELRAEGAALGRAEGAALGRAEGAALGRAEGAALVLLRVLRRRGLAVSQEAEARILATTDLDRIEGWTDRAIGAGTLDDVFIDD